MSRSFRLSVWLLLLTIMAAGIWRERQPLLCRGLELALTVAGLNEPKIAGIHIDGHSAELASLEFGMETLTGPLTVKLDKVAGDYHWPLRKLGRVHIGAAAIKLGYRPVSKTVSSAVFEMPALPLDGLAIDHLRLEIDTPWGLSAFDGQADFEQQADRGLSGWIRDGQQSLHLSAANDFRAGSVSIDHAQFGRLAELRAERFDQSGTQIQLRTSAGSLRQWLNNNSLLPRQLESRLAQWSVPPDLAAIALRLDIDSANGLADWHGWLLMTLNDDYLASVDLSRSAQSQMLTADAHLDMSAPQVWAWLQPWLPGGLGDWRLDGGRVQATSRLHWQTGHDLSGIAHLRSYDGNITSGAMKAINCRLEIDVNSIAARSARLNLNADRLEFGNKLKLTDFDAELHSRDQTIAIEHAAVNAFGGQLAIAPGELTLGQIPLRLILEVRNIDLQPLLATVNYPQLSGSGRISGKLPLSLAKESISMEGGTLSGEQAGVLRYRGPTEDDGNIAFKALRNLVYHKLQAALDYQPNGDYRVGLHLEGNNPELMAGHPLAFNLNLSGHLPELLQRGILSGDFERSILEQSQNRRRP